jgi:hypothetical protein
VCLYIYTHYNIFHFKLHYIVSSLLIQILKKFKIKPFQNIFHLPFESVVLSTCPFTTYLWLGPQKNPYMT